MRLLPLLLLTLSLLGPRPSDGASLAGICPDGSAFVVQRKEDIPCAAAKLVEPSEIPPLRPELLPRPYPWLVDQQVRNPNNPYNLIEAAEKIRGLHEARQGAAQTEASQVQNPPPTEAGGGPAPGADRAGPPVAPEDVEALLDLVDLRQDVAAAELLAEDALGNGRMQVRFAYSVALEDHILRWLGRRRDERRVLLFAVRAIEAGEFYPNFFFLQEGQGFRPDVQQGAELGFLLGDPGDLDRGAARLGYVVLPGRFLPEQAIELWWNDRRVEAVLAPGV